MTDLLIDFRLAFGALRLRYSMVILAASLFGTALLIGLLSWLVGWIFAHSGLFGTFEPDDGSWKAWLSGGMGSLMMMAAGWFIYPSLATAVVCLFVEDLATRIEKSSYPDLPQPREISMLEQVKAFWQSLRRAITYNLFALPFYFIPVLNLVAYLLVNGRLLLREYFFAVTLRHLSLEDATALYRTEKPKLFMTSLLLAGLFIVPVVNLMAPILATSLLIHQLMRKSDSPLRQKLAMGTAKMLLNPEVGDRSDDGTPPPQH